MSNMLRYTIRGAVVAKSYVGHQLLRLRLPYAYSLYSTRVETFDKAFEKEGMPSSVINMVPMSKYGGITVVTLITGESLIGQQGGRYIKSLVETSMVPISLDRVIIDNKRNDFKEHLLSMLRNRVGVYIELEMNSQQRRMRTELNRYFDLYACVAKMKSQVQMNCKYPNVDIWTICENNTGDFAKLEYEVRPGIVETLRISTEEHMTHYLKFAFRYSLENCRRKVTIIHSSNKLPKYDGLFWKLAQSVHDNEFREIELEGMHVNKAMRKVVMCPEQFDVICMQSGYSYAVTAAVAGICGGAGLFTSIDIGDHFAIVKPLEVKLSLSDCHSLSPYGIVRSCSELLRYLKNEDCADIIETELENVICSGVKTEEFGGTDISDFVICSIVNKLKCHFA